LSIENILRKIRKGEISVSEAKKQLSLFTIKNIENFARLDLNRHLRRKIPEVVFAEKKNPVETSKIVEELVKQTGKAIASRVSEEHIKELKKLEKKFKVEVYEKARVVVVKKPNVTLTKTGGKVGVLTAGTTDIPVAEEAVVILKESGCEVYTAYDVGVAGLHRLFQPLKKMLKKNVDVLIVVAGMEGALPSVVASLVDCPVVGVPTSVGYGYGGGGKAALMTMLQSCSLGLAVVNIDNGIGAGAFASIIANRAAEARKTKKF